MDNERRVRRFSRIPLDRPATLEIRGVHRAGEVHDLSLKGALLELKDGPPPPRGTVGSLTVHLGAEAIVRTDGEVVHVNGQLLGISFDELDLDSMIHLRRLVEMNTGDEALLHRELAALVAEREW